MPIVLLVTAVLTVATYLGVEQPVHRSPWLERRRAVTEEAPVVPEPVAVAPTPVRPAALASRPAGWVPGQRYYPGSRARMT
ncbi:hypothetical protein, partial [Pseudomonas promysalinigenes]|uniref:hypothetical protein n=1 Tax=Pseudomonas promysalinigenes TaxID=485898 RepID=UPI003FA03D53